MVWFLGEKASLHDSVLCVWERERDYGTTKVWCLQNPKWCNQPAWFPFLAQSSGTLYFFSLPKAVKKTYKFFFIFFFRLYSSSSFLSSWWLVGSCMVCAYCAFVMVHSNLLIYKPHLLDINTDRIFSFFLDIIIY